MKRARLGIVMLLLVNGSVAAPPQPKWYKFDKALINAVFPPDSAIGVLRAEKSYPAAQIHSISCGGNDGELHVGIPPHAVNVAGTGHAVSGPAIATEEFGVVAEPPNATRSLLNTMSGFAGHPTAFHGYFRVWNEGHDVGAVYPSNPHHVLEVHPAWGIQSGGAGIDKPGTIFPMPNYSGYGSSKFVPLLASVSHWLLVADETEYIYVQLLKADNFYQLPVRIKEIHQVTGGLEATVDVYSRPGQTQPVYPDLSVIAAEGTKVAAQLAQGQDTILLGFFSVNLRKAMSAAQGHAGIPNAVLATKALEFFAFGFPQRPAVAQCQ